MDGHKRLTRKKISVPARDRQLAQKGHRATGNEEPEFPVFGEREQRDFDTSTHPIRIFDRETLRYLAVNDAALKLYGYTREEFLALTPLDTRHPEESEDFYATLREPTGYLRFREPRRHVTKDGRVIVVEIVIQDILYRGRNARSSLTMDVTKRIRGEQMLRQREQEFRALVSNAPDIIARFDRDLRYVYVNPAGTAATGLAPQMLLGKTNRELGMPAELVELWEADLRSVFASGREKKMEFAFPAPQDLRHYEARMVPEFNARHEVDTVLSIARDITKRKRAEEALRTSEEFSGRVIASSRDCIKVLDLDARLLSINVGGQRLLEIDDVTPLLSRPWLDFWRGADKEAARNAVVAAGRGATGQFEGYCATAKGLSKWWDVVVTPILGADGKPEKLLAISRDITKRKRAEGELKRQKKLLDTIIEHLPVGIAVKDANTLRYLLRNRMAAELTGLNNADVIGKRADEVYPPDLAEFIRESDHEALSNRGRTSSRVFRQRTGRSVRGLKVAVPDESGRHTHLVSIIEDLTDIERAQTALRRSEARLKQLISMSPAAIFSFSLDPTFATTYISENVTAQLGWAPSEFTGSPSFWFDHLHPDDQAAASEAVARIASDGRYVCEYRFRHKDGGWRWMHDESQVVHDADSTPREAIGIWMDVTAKREETEERLQRALRQRDALVREVHHRIKNHLQGIAGLLREKMPAYPAVAPLVESVVAQMKSVALVYGLQNGVDTAVSLGGMLAAICASLEGLLSCRIVRKWDAEQDGCVRVAANEAVPVAVALNELVFNAIKHCERNAGVAAVEVDYSEHGLRAEIHIANRGILPRGFDYARGAGCSTGLDLVKTLLGPKGNALALWTRGNMVETVLTLEEPLVALRAVQAAA